MALRRFLILAAATAISAGCSHPAVPAAGPQRAPEASESATATMPPDPEEVGANELGLVPVLMYHRIVPEPTSVYDRTPEDFRAELQRLADEDYVPVTTAELASGDLDLPREPIRWC